MNDSTANAATSASNHTLVVSAFLSNGPTLIDYMRKTLSSFSWFFMAISYVISSCSSDKLPNHSKPKEIQVGILKLRIPEQFKHVQEQGVDSDVAYLINNHNDTFHVEYGEQGIIYDLFDLPPVAFPLNSKDTLEKLQGKMPSEMGVFTKSFEKDNLLRTFHQNFYMYDTVNSIIQRIVQPKKIGYGMTGVYIPELKNGMSFSMYAKNLDSSHHIEAIHLFKTISY